VFGIGKSIRLERITNRQTGHTVIVPMDHGVTVGPIPGLIDMAGMVEHVAEGGADAVLGHVGLPRLGHRGYGPDIGLILHLSASTRLAPDPDHKVLVSNLERAIKYGADAVSIHINLGAEYESEMLRDLGQVAMSCEEWGMPLVAMMYTRGPNIQDEHDVEVVKHAARVAAELGADIVKCDYTGSPETFRQVTEGCGPVKVVIAGGAKLGDDRALLEMVWGAMQAGAAGASIGRNAFQHDNPKRITQAICAIVHGGKSVEDALAILAS
jgi:fructose-bisphosphate aldolase/2-amino-3,7-dideoxy-D-threo-hept-6-ulosonate synthase